MVSNTYSKALLLGYEFCKHLDSVRDRLNAAKDKYKPGSTEYLHFIGLAEDDLIRVRNGLEEPLFELPPIPKDSELYVTVINRVETFEARIEDMKKWT